MAKFEIGNQWWKNRAKSGRDAIFTDPEILRQSIQEYFDLTDSRRDWDGQEWVGKDGDEVIVKKRVPFTLKGLCVFLGVSSHYFSEFKKSQTFQNNPEFLEVYTWAEDVIQTQQIDGGLLGYYNASLTARLNGLTDKQDITSAGEAIKPTIIVQSQQAAENLKKLSE